MAAPDISKFSILELLCLPYAAVDEMKRRGVVPHEEGNRPVRRKHQTKPRSDLTVYVRVIPSEISVSY